MEIDWAWVANPWGMSPVAWIAAWAASRVGIAVWDFLVIGLVHLTKQPMLPTRTSGKPVRFVETDLQSAVFLFFNSFQEHLFVLHLAHFCWFSDQIPRTLGELTVWNTVPALYLLFLVNDMVYAPAHRFLHWKVVYPYIHKHHHRQIFPARGYLDAGNEHPIEHMVGLVSVVAAIVGAMYTTGIHAATIFLFQNIHAALAMLNHSPYDVNFSFLGFKYSVGAHEMHHRQFTTNYAQYFMFWDDVMGTFTPYCDASPTAKASKLGEAAKTVKGT